MEESTYADYLGGCEMRAVQMYSRLWIIVAQTYGLLATAAFAIFPQYKYYATSIPACSVQQKLPSGSYIRVSAAI
jgi:hypothetical protein